MTKRQKRPIIYIETFYDGKATIHEVFGKVYAQIFREKLHEVKSAPLIDKTKDDKLKSS